MSRLDGARGRLGDLVGRGSRGLLRMSGQTHRLLLVVVILIGAGCGIVAVLFHHALALARELMIGAALALPEGPWRLALIVLVPAASGAVLAALVPKLSPEAGGGLALVRRAYSEGTERLDARTLAGTFVANPLSLGAGTPLGPEGPTVVLTSGFAAGAARALGLPGRVVRGMIPVGTAAGIAAIFNAPITGVVFALEEVIGTASRGVLGSSLVAAVAAAVVQRRALGGRALLPAAPADWRDARELAGFALLGLICGVFSGWIPRAVPVFRAGLTRLVSRAGRFRAAARGGAVGAAVGLLGVISPDILGIGYTPVSRWLSGGGTASETLVAFLAKVTGMALALSAPLVGGVFAPSLFAGASLGSAVGHLAHILFPLARIDPGAYALVGMGAFFAGFLRTPIASVLIVFELTGDYGLVVPLMLAVALSSVVSRRISATTLVEAQLDAQRVHAPASHTDPLSLLRVRDVMTAPVISFPDDVQMIQAVRLAAGTRHPLYPVTAADGTCVGVVEAETIDAAARAGRLEEPVSHLSRPARVVAVLDEPLDAVSLRMASERETRCPVVASPDDPRLVGILTPSDLLRARLQAVEDSGMLRRHAG